MHRLEARDVVNLVEDRQRQDLTHARDRAKALKHVGVVLLGHPYDEQFEVADDAVVVPDQR